MGKSFNEVIAALQFEAMGIGGLGAYIIYKRKKDISESFLYSKLVQIILFVFICSYVLLWKELSAASVVFRILWTTPIVSSCFMMLIFCWLIINVALNDKSIVTLRSKYLHFLGEISYGIYMYHMLVVFAIVVVCTKLLNKLNPVVSTFVFYIAITSATILVSYLSKRFFEERFLGLKKRFEK